MAIMRLEVSVERVPVVRGFEGIFCRRKVGQALSHVQISIQHTPKSLEHVRSASQANICQYSSGATFRTLRLF